MFGSAILDVIIGIIFVFILVSTICTAIREGIESWLKTRAVYLEYGIRELLHDKPGRGLANSFYNHPLIYSLYSKEYKPGNKVDFPSIFTSGDNLPSYIPSKNFAVALMDIAARGPKTDLISSDPQSPIISIDSVRTNIANIDNPAVQRVLLTALDSAQGDLNKMQANLEAWYDSAMDRVSGWYKRATQWIILWVALVVAVGLNINTIAIANYLIKNDAVRKAFADNAIASASEPSRGAINYQDARKELEAFDLPIGWSEKPKWLTRGNGDIQAWKDFFAPLLGWLITALAAMLGAPFWFDVLNKVMVIRSTVKPHEKSPEESSEDRQKNSSRHTLAQDVQSAPTDIVVANAASSAEAPDPRDVESDVDGCDVEIDNLTKDEELPMAQGGVLT